ncbi:unnamed protein product [Cuscuta epithymum]|uniref:NAC domain-containing protein n=1 Tax=Cuscuta epithymum TaxID=186058 RepID=A0AAV0CHV1_9ASTE|nr:unnamed protein product [Cuscuta epithymum]
MAKEHDHIGPDMPIGYKFLPTDEELVEHYLMNKVFLRPIPANNIIQDIHTDELYSKSPKSLVENLAGEREWYFFILEDDYYYGKVVKNRVVVGSEKGFWSSMGEEPICNSEGDVLGYKIHFTFFSAGSKKTHWRMEKYRLPACQYNNAVDQEPIIIIIITIIIPRERSCRRSPGQLPTGLDAFPFSRH